MYEEVDTVQQAQYTPKAGSRLGQILDASGPDAMGQTKHVLLQEKHGKKRVRAWCRGAPLEARNVAHKAK